MNTFELLRPASTQAALQAVRPETGAEARFLAGGQSLVQAMKLGLASSDRLVDLAGVAGLDGIELRDGQLFLGAMARHADVAASALVRQWLPALAELAEGIGDPMVRSMGTLGGSVANADPAACYPAAVLGLESTVCTDRREIDGQSFFTGLYETALQPSELILGLRFALPERAAYAKLRQPASRFALVGVFVSQGAQGVRVAVTGAAPCVFRLTQAEAALQRRFDPQVIADVEVPSEGLLADLHAPAPYRAAMIKVMARRAVERAVERAAGRAPQP